MHSRTLPLVFCFLASVHGTDAAADSLQSSGRALQHSANAIGYALAGTSQLVSGVAAVPLGFVGAIGEVSNAASDALMDAANSDVGAPLPISEEVVTAGPPPSTAIQTNPGAQP